jgi:predicted dehydrogenase
MDSVQVRKVGIIMNGVTGRMGTNQHLMRSIVPIIHQGGVEAGNNVRIVPDPILVGRNPVKLERLTQMSGIEKWTTNLDEALADESYEIYFDSQTTDRRAEAVEKAVAAGKHIYCEKPTAVDSRTAYDLYKTVHQAGLKHGVVQDKLWLPGIVKLKTLIETGFFGRILSVKGEFGYWVFTGEHIPAQRPSWNYRKEDGGGIIIDMLCHWRYVLDNVFGDVQAVNCLGATHLPKRWDESGQAYDATADDAAYATFQLDGDIIAQFNSSWCTRVRRDDLLTIQVDGTEGSAVAGLRKCWIQPLQATPRPVWNPDVDSPINYFQTWQEVPDQAGEMDNAFKIQWELFLRHVAADAPFRWDLREGAKGVQLAELGLESWKKRQWLDVPEMPAL